MLKSAQGMSAKVTANDCVCSSRRKCIQISKGIGFGKRDARLRMNRIHISITRFDDVKEACRAAISIFNSYPSHLLMLQDRPEKKVRSESSSKSAIRTR